MSRTLTLPIADPSTVSDAPKPTAAEILERARRVMAWRPRDRETDAYRQAEVQQMARAIVLYESPIGIAALAVGETLDALIASVEAFLEIASCAGEAKKAAKAALAETGIAEQPDHICMGYSTHQFARLPNELLGWLFTLRVMRERIEETGPPDLREEPD